MTIQNKCNKLNRDIHNKLFLNNYLSTTIGDYERVFTSIDLIEDCQEAIEEFENLPESAIKSRTTLYIYGVLQSMYCQQDGLFHLYRTITKENIKNVYELFEIYNFNTHIREVRDDIAGHPADRKGKEFYFIAKGSNSKYLFSYAGYTPHFRNVDVDLKQFISEQKDFAVRVLDKVEQTITEKINIHKSKFNSLKLAEFLDKIHYPTQLIYRGITNNHPLAASGLQKVNDTLNKLKAELNSRYNNKVPDSINDIFRLQNHILTKVENWISDNTLEKNMDAEVFMNSFDNQVNELIDILKEIDDEFAE